ncbi:unnamed protein product [Heligmosomoides polygyrus]|uniref:DUF4371 domain-containing protein n=1 Tax=Heligmosomoides polygyrus TaxID=6339 RepID=A0A183FSC1_HELPZ|nr:unnamed protein product [Heligmosomoides polygyrus]
MVHAGAENDQFKFTGMQFASKLRDMSIVNELECEKFDVQADTMILDILRAILQHRETQISFEKSTMHVPFFSCIGRYSQ